MKTDIQNIISSSTALEVDLLTFVVYSSKMENINRVDLYNIFHKLLIKYEDEDEDIYDIIANIMDYIWTGTNGETKIYTYSLSDKDLKIRKSSRRFFNVTN